MRAQPLPDDTSLCVPYLAVVDPERSLVFYAQAFGFETEACLETDDGQIVHAGMRYHGKSILMMAPERTPWGEAMQAPLSSRVPMPLVMYVYCEDVDFLATQAEHAGAVIDAPPTDMFWGDRVVQLRDPDEYKWSFATRVGELEPDRMPAGLRMSSL